MDIIMASALAIQGPPFSFAESGPSLMPFRLSRHTEWYNEVMTNAAIA